MWSTRYISAKHAGSCGSHGKSVGSSASTEIEVQPEVLEPEDRLLEILTSYLEAYVFRASLISIVNALSVTSMPSPCSNMLLEALLATSDLFKFLPRTYLPPDFSSAIAIPAISFNAVSLPANSPHTLRKGWYFSLELSGSHPNQLSVADISFTAQGQISLE